jgi:antitoxin HicB
VAAAEEEEESEQVEQRADHMSENSRDQSRAINRLTPDGGSAKDSIVSARAPGYRPLEDEGSALGRLIGLQWSRPGGERMRFFSFEIVIEREAEDDGYSAYSPTLPGCFSNGKTIEEAKRHIREAIQQHVEALLARGQPVPHVEELTDVRRQLGE